MVGSRGGGADTFGDANRRVHIQWKENRRVYFQVRGSTQLNTWRAGGENSPRISTKRQTMTWWQGEETEEFLFTITRVWSESDDSKFHFQGRDPSSSSCLGKSELARPIKCHCVDAMEHLTSPHKLPGTLYPGLPLDPLEPCSQPLDPLVTWRPTPWLMGPCTPPPWPLATL